VYWGGQDSQTTCPSGSSWAFVELVGTDVHLLGYKRRRKRRRLREAQAARRADWSFPPASY
jgi:hypothetical protein